MLTIQKLSILDVRYKEMHENPKFNNQVKNRLFRLWGTQIFTCLIDFLLVMQTKVEYLLLLFETKKIQEGIKMNRIL